MATSYKRNSKKLYKLTFMSVFCVQVPWEKKQAGLNVFEGMCD